MPIIDDSVCFANLQAAYEICADGKMVKPDQAGVGDSAMVYEGAVGGW